MPTDDPSPNDPPGDATDEPPVNEGAPHRPAPLRPLSVSILRMEVQALAASLRVPPSSDD
jgi:hypothetical protein